MFVFSRSEEVGDRLSVRLETQTWVASQSEVERIRGFHRNVRGRKVTEQMPPSEARAKRALPPIKPEGTSGAPVYQVIDLAHANHPTSPFLDSADRHGGARNMTARQGATDGLLALRRKQLGEKSLARFSGPYDDGDANSTPMLCGSSFHGVSGLRTTSLAQKLSGGIQAQGM